MKVVVSLKSCYNTLQYFKKSPKTLLSYEYELKNIQNNYIHYILDNDIAIKIY